MSESKAAPVGRVLLKNVRLAFPNLFTPTTVDGEGKPRYSAAFILPRDHPQVLELQEKMVAIAKDKWGAKAPDIYKAAKAANKLALQDGDSKAQYDGYAGNLFINAASQESNRPTVIDRNRAPLAERDGKPYAGCYVNASIDLWAQDNKYGKRINAQLRGVQFFADGDAFAAGRPADSDEFEALDAGNDAEDFA